MALVTVDLHGQVLQPGGLTPAVGSVQLRIMQELRDLVDDVVYSPDTFVGTLDVNGEFTILDLPTTDNPDITPMDWVYEVYINTDVLRSRFFVQLPASAGPLAELSDLLIVDFDPCTGLAADISEGGTVPHTHPYLPLTGGTITGDLTVLGVTTIEHGTSYSVDGGELLSMASSTGTVVGGVISANLVTPSSLDIGPLVAYVVDVNTDQANPAVTRLNLPAQTVAMDAGALSRPQTWWLVDAAGTVIQQADRETATQRRSHITLGLTIQSGGVIIAAQSIPAYINAQPGPQLLDLMEGLGTFPIRNSQLITPNGANLMINASGGPIFNRNVHYRSGGTFPADPHFLQLPAQTPAVFFRATQTNPLLSGPHNTVDVANIDVGGVVTPLGGGVNTSSVIRVWISQSIIMQYGQTAHASLTAAIDSIGQTNWIPNPNINGGSALIAYIAATRTATNLSDPSQARIIRASKFASS